MELNKIKFTWDKEWERSRERRNLINIEIEEGGQQEIDWVWQDTQWQIKWEEINILREI